MGHYRGFSWWEAFLGVVVILVLSIGLYSIAPLVFQIALGVFFGVMLVGIFSDSK